jgi:predicted amidohydrolase YtcJ
MKIQNTSLLLVGALACTPVVAQPADIILTQGKIISADAQDKIYQAMAVRDGKIIALGKSKEMQAWKGSQTQVINLKGKVVIPGLIDSHMHAIRAALSYSTEVHWFGLNSIEAALDKLKQAAVRAKPGEWLIVAGGWTEEQFKEGRRPTQEELSLAAPNNPVYVQWMYEWVMLTPAAYKTLNIQSEADLPGGGKFQLDANGKPTGAIIGGIVPLFDKLPKPNFEDKVNGTQKFFSELNRVGVTGVIDPGGFNMSPTEYAPLFQVWRNKQLTVRVNYSYFAQKPNKEFEEFKELTQLLPMRFGDDMLRFNGIGERVTFSMYNNDKATPADQEKFYQVARWAAQNGYTLTQHWQENASAATLLDVFERVNQEFPIAKLRWSIAHLNNGTEATFKRMKALGVGWAMQDAMYLDGDKALHRHGDKQLERMPPINTALKLGIPIGAGTDAHRVADYNPFIALRWMLDGKSASGRKLRGDDEIPSRMQALKMYTSGSAWLAHDEQKRGTLEVGKLADLAVLSDDYLNVPLEKIAQIHSQLTMVGGNIVYREGLKQP